MEKMNFCFAFVHQDKVFDWVLTDVVSWALRKLGIEEWLVKIIQSMDWSPGCHVRVNGTLSCGFLLQVGLHQSSVLSPMLLIIVMEGLYREMGTGCPEKLLYTEDLTLVSETFEGLKGRLES